ncbi:ComEC/Rec2 family competence protein [Polaribacter sp.]|uniref:ComEC/Rec2 family competence protein n=1 Tax=Polaribacter sp. TaxID=1920175 RepID=UPI003F6D6037
MKTLLQYIPLQLLLCFILGILLQFQYQFWGLGFGFTLLFILLLTTFFIFLKNRKIFTICGFVLFFFLGTVSVYFNTASNYKTYFNKHLTKNNYVVLKIKKVLKPGFYYQKYVAEVQQVGNLKTRGEVLLNVEKDSLQERLHIDDAFLINPIFKELIPPLNPLQFNYKSYLAKQDIKYQVFTNNSQILLLDKNNATLVGFAEKFRETIQDALLKYDFKEDEFAVISALLLGQRQDISKALLTDYANAGAIHILAVSGLHVGILLLILSFLLKPIENFKKGTYIKAMLIVLLLWMFAFIAGLSASVVRAVTMFTFLVVGQLFKRRNVVAFSLISSLFFLLIVKPMFLFDVGFQLSYLAVFGIIWVQPKLYGIYKPRFILDDKIWQLFTVSIAAQVGILPLSIYYFNQFPGLFVLSNLLIIPFLGAILIGGILVILLALLNVLPPFIATIYSNIIGLMNNFVSWISHQEEFLLKDISISFLLMLSFYLLLFSLVSFFMKMTPKRILYFLITVILVQSVFIFEKKHFSDKTEFIVFHKSRFGVIGNRAGAKIDLQQNIDSIKIAEITAIKPYVMHEQIQNVSKVDFKNFIVYKKQPILLVDSLGVYDIKNIVKPIVVLQYSPKINLERLITKLQPITIVADGSNYKSYVTRWEKTSSEHNIKFHYTGQKGAFILK